MDMLMRTAIPRQLQDSQSNRKKICRDALKGKTHRESLIAGLTAL